MSYHHIFRAEVVRTEHGFSTRWFGKDNNISPWPTLGEAMRTPLEEIKSLCFPLDVDPEVVAKEVESLAREYDGGSLRENNVRGGLAAYRLWQRRFKEAGLLLREARLSRVVYSPLLAAVAPQRGGAEIPAGTDLSQIPASEVWRIRRAQTFMEGSASFPQRRYVAWFEQADDGSLTTVALSRSPTSRKGYPVSPSGVKLVKGIPAVKAKPPIMGVSPTEAIARGLADSNDAFVVAWINHKTGALHCLGGEFDWRSLGNSSSTAGEIDKSFEVVTRADAKEAISRARDFDSSMVLVPFLFRDFLREFFPNFNPAPKSGQEHAPEREALLLC